MISLIPMLVAAKCHQSIQATHLNWGLIQTIVDPKMPAYRLAKESCKKLQNV